MTKACSVSDCARPVIARGFCSPHYARWYKHGDPLGGKAPGSNLKWLKEQTSYAGEDCLIWPFSRDPRGYGEIFYEGRLRRAHRVMCILVYGDPPTATHHAAHRCGNGHLGCINPKHLRWATPSENCADRVIHGTANRGERQGLSKLNREQVRQIRQLSAQGVFQRVIAKQFGIGKSTVWQITTGRTWNWL